MVKFLLLALVLGVSCAHHNNPDITPSEVSGNWRTLYIGADNVEKVLKDGPLRAYFKHMECSDECQTLTITFNVKVEGECQTHTVVGRKEKDDLYMTDYSGKNYFQVVKKSDDIIIFHNVNVDNSGKETNVILVAGKEESLSKAQKQELKELANKFNIPNENIQHLEPTDTCHQ
ncbi:odorant-binding protein-like [Peromyscus californicus insignis]|uniref:odorant-binding protein-like n=1 Tax=Peromyscus californicus insignis TaxID=564181 RepID=UPI0022A660A7|nr:odorant-binding protein-like [Peromyscus californicus insignis]